MMETCTGTIGASKIKFYRIGNLYHNTNESFIVDDVFDVLSLTDPDIKQIIWIIDIFTEPDERNKGNASKLLDQFLEDHKDDIIVTTAELKKEYFPERPDKETFENELVKQSLFLEYRGFRNINVLCKFEHRIPFIYINEKAKNFLKYILESEIDIDDNY